QSVADRVKMHERERDAGEPALHVARAASIDPSTHDLPAPGSPRPFVLGDGKDVDMPVQHKMAACPRAIKSCQDIWHFRMWREALASETRLAQSTLKKCGGRPRVAGRIGRGHAQ